MLANDFIIFFFIYVIIFWSQPFCNGATHWIVTEDGRIQQQVDSIFNLKRPYDLVTFIRQQETFDRMKMLREEYLEEKKKVIEAREKERQQTKTSFYKVDPDCIEAGGHVSEFELQLDTAVSFADKGINIADHISLCQTLSTRLDRPFCQVELPFTMHNYDHLRGVNSRHEMNHTVPEPGLVKTLPYFKDVDELGSRLRLALDKNSSSWILLNLAAYYWRIKGDGLHAVECLRRALYFSPRAHKDRALLSLAAVLYHANYTLDSVILMHASLEITNDLPLYHFLLGNVYSSLQMYEMAELCYKFALAVTHDTKQLCGRIKAVRCELKLEKLLEDRQLAFDEKLDSLKTPELNDSGELSKEELSNKKLLPLETFKIQLNYIHRKIVRTSDTVKCDSNAIHRKQEPSSSTKHVKGPGKGTGTHVKEMNDKTVIKDKELSHQEDSKRHERHTKKHSQGMVKEMTAEATLDLKAKMNFVDAKNGLEDYARSPQTECVNNAKGSLEKKAIEGSEQTIMAVDRGTKVMREKNANEISKQYVSSNGVAESTSSEREVKVQSGRLGRVGKRGESGTKRGNSEADFNAHVEKNSLGSMFLESVKIPKQKGDFTTLVYKNARGNKAAGAGSKNSRDISRAKLFEEAEGSVPRGPKHTPPLKSIEAKPHQKNCQSYAGKKRKGECWSEKTSAEQPQGSVGDIDVPVPAKSSASKAEFFKGLPSTQFSSESVVIGQSVAEDISPTAAFEFKTSTIMSTSEPTLGEGAIKEVAEKSSPKDGDGKISESSSSKGSIERTPSREKTEQATVKPESRKPPDNKEKTSQIPQEKKADEFAHKVGAGADGFETKFMNVNTDGSVYGLNEEECGRVQGVETLIARNKLFSAWLSLGTKDVDVQAHIDLLRDVDDLPKRPRCNAKIKKNAHTFDDLQGVMNAAKLEQVVEAGLTQTLLSMGGIMQPSVDVMGTRIYNAMKKNSTSWVLLNIASLYWRILGDTTEAIKCLRHALYHSPATARDVAQVSLASILLREGRLEDTTVVIEKALEISPTLALGHFILGNVYGAQNKIPEAIQHYLFSLRLEPGFGLAKERLKIIQCILWRQQKDLEREADELRKLLPVESGHK